MSKTRFKCTLKVSVGFREVIPFMSTQSTRPIIKNKNSFFTNGESGAHRRGSRAFALSSCHTKDRFENTRPKHISAFLSRSSRTSRVTSDQICFYVPWKPNMLLALMHQMSETDKFLLKKSIFFTISLCPKLSNANVRVFFFFSHFLSFHVFIFPFSHFFCSHQTHPLLLWR